MQEIKFLKVSIGFLLFVLLLFIPITYPHQLPNVSDDLIEYNGCLTFGQNNTNDVSYSPGDHPFDQLYSTYKNEKLDPNYPNPPYDPETIGYGIWQNDAYPFSGNTQIISEKYSHKNVLESRMYENGYMEGYNFPDSPNSGVYAVEFYWAWETISASLYGPTPRITFQTENGLFMLLKTGEDPINHWRFSYRTNESTNLLKSDSTELTTETINPGEFYYYKFSFNLDNNIATCKIYGKQTVTLVLTVSIDFGKIQFFSFGSGQDYSNNHWIDSLSWTWDSEYEEGDLLLSQSGGTTTEPKNIWDYWYYFLLGIVSLGGITTVIIVLAKRKTSRGKIPTQDFGVLPQHSNLKQCPICGNMLSLASYEAIEFCPYCGFKFAKK
jgi:hypothetical protein